VAGDWVMGDGWQGQGSCDCYKVIRFRFRFITLVTSPHLTHRKHLEKRRQIKHCGAKKKKKRNEINRGW